MDRPSEPVVAGVVVATLRELMLEHGIWRETRRISDQSTERPMRMLDDACGREWVPMHSYCVLLDALGTIYETDRIHKLGGEWLDRALMRGFMANMVRSWLRSFARTPYNVTLLVPHLWKVVHREMGRMNTHVRGEGFVTMRVTPLPQWVLDCAPWQRLLEGVGDALFALAETDGSVQIGPAMTPLPALDFLVLGADARP